MISFGFGKCYIWRGERRRQLPVRSADRTRRGCLDPEGAPRKRQLVAGRARMCVIAISRGTFSGGKALAECLGRTLGYRTIDLDTVLRRAATARVSEYDLRVALEEPPELPGLVSHKRYLYLCLIQAALWEEVRCGKAVYHGLAGQVLLKGAPTLLRLRIIAPLEARIRAARERLNLSREEAVVHIDRADHDRRKWTRCLYGLDWENPSLYDLTINLEHLTIEQSCRLVVSAITDPSFESTPQTESILNDLALASRVRRELALNPLTLDLELEVRALGGSIMVRGPNLEDDWEAIERVARSVPGVLDCHGSRSAAAARSSAR